MRIEGRLWKDERWWLVEIPMLDAMTQGRTRKEALLMAADLVVTMVNREGFTATAHPVQGDRLEISVSDTAALVAEVLRRQRGRHGLTLEQVARRLGRSSLNAYARYEQGRAVPSITKLEELLRAVEPDSDLVLRLSST